MSENYEDDIGDLVDRMSELTDADAAQRAEALKQGLADYDLDDEDISLLESHLGDTDEVIELPALPVLAIVGRPNVGKSALVNRILGRREAVVEDVPGVTRDRVTYKAEWNDRKFTLVDTGGWEPDARGIDKSVAIQAEIAVELADAVLFVVDAMVGATATDERVVTMLRASKKPVILVGNKVDDARQEPEAASLWSLGLGEPWPVSALHGRGVADMLDKVLTILPEISAVAKTEIGGPRRVAIIGRPNVGKSSLLNKTAGEERVVVNELAGTTRDPIDEQVELGGKVWRFVDTAGIRRRQHMAQGADFYASLRTAAALEKAERDVRLERLTASHRIERLMEAGQFGRAIGGFGIEIEIGPHDAFDHEPERPLAEADEHGTQRRLTVECCPKHQGEVRADQVGLARMILRAQTAQRGVVCLAEHRPGHDIQHQL